MTLMLELRVFPRFKDFVVLFGARNDENENGLPQLRFRRFHSSNSDISQQLCSGIGND